MLDDRDLWSRFMSAELTSLDRFVQVIDGGVRVLGADRPGGRRVAETRDLMAFLRTEMADVIARWPAERERRAAGRGLTAAG